MRINQRDRMLKYLMDFGSITRLEAMSELGIIEAPARISELRQRGHIITTSREYGKNRYGETVSWAKWTYGGKNV